MNRRIANFSIVCRTLRRSGARALCLASFSVVSTACWDPVPSAAGASSPASFPVVLAVVAGKEAPVQGAEIFSGKQSLGKTDAKGLATLRLEGRDGETVPVTVKCPAGFSSPEAPVQVALRELASGSRPPRFEARCTATTHAVVIAIRAEHGANLPIVHLNRRVGTTDVAGVAHVLLSNVTPDQPISLTLDTSREPSLRPQNPVLTFVPAARDELVLLEQEFTNFTPKPKSTRAAKPVGPQRL